MRFEGIRGNMFTIRLTETISDCSERNFPSNNWRVTNQELIRFDSFSLNPHDPLWNELQMKL